MEKGEIYEFKNIIIKIIEIDKDFFIYKVIIGNETYACETGMISAMHKLSIMSLMAKNYRMKLKIGSIYRNILSTGTLIIKCTEVNTDNTYKNIGGGIILLMDKQFEDIYYIGEFVYIYSNEETIELCKQD